MRRILCGVLAAVSLTACSNSGGGEPEAAPSDDRARDALAEVTSLEGSSAAANEEAFVDELIETMSRPYWDTGPEAMVRAYEVCASGTPSAEVFNLVDEGFSREDAETFVDAASSHLC